MKTRPPVGLRRSHVEERKEGVCCSHAKWPRRRKNKKKEERGGEGGRRAIEREEGETGGGRAIEREEEEEEGAVTVTVLRSFSSKYIQCRTRQV